MFTKKAEFIDVDPLLAMLSAVAIALSETNLGKFLKFVVVGGIMKFPYVSAKYGNP